ncbi:aliphatic sulfonate ABC transporter substrate-binding protein [Lysinibacillus sp. NPDC097195]|uniref:aliphatic sulfonate ABC transporter substrate-binding protein n=1 Tax=Lysinibacillus sp. NPDC097195 TaxID=3364141 RepID=UPI00381A30A0
MKKQWKVFALLLTLVVFLIGCAKHESAAEESANSKEIVVKIGVQGSGGLFGKAQEERLFEKAFAPYGATVEWVEFQSGPPMTEAIASNKLDFAGLGNMPIIAAQAAGIPFTVISQVLEGKKNVGVVVNSANGITNLHDLMGKKVAVGKGTNAYDFLLRGLKKEGLNPEKLELINLNPDEAQAAFDAGSIDAWAVWEPYLTINTLSGKGTIIADGEKLDLLSPSYQIVRTAFAEQHADLVVAYLKTYNELLQWELDNEEEAVNRYATERKLSVTLIEETRKRARGISIPVSDEVIEEHQNTADFQYKIGTIRKAIKVKDVFDNHYIEEALK